MPIEYEMKYLKETVESAISEYSNKEYSDDWHDGVEDEVLNMNNFDLRKNFNDSQRNAIWALSKRGYWVRKIKASEKVDEESWYSLVRLDNIIKSTKRPKIYIAGPMSGHPKGNRDVFNAKEKQLVSAGWEVINPAKMDAETGIDPESLGEYDYEDCARRDIEVLVECDAIYMLAGFQFSKGACWERALAKHLGIKRYYEVPRADHEFV